MGIDLRGRDGGGKSALPVGEPRFLQLLSRSLDVTLNVLPPIVSSIAMINIYIPNFESLCKQCYNIQRQLVTTCAHDFWLPFNCPIIFPLPLFFFLIWRNSPQWARASSFMRFLDYTQRRTAVGRTPLDEGSDHRRDLYLTTYNVHNRQTSTPPVGFEPIIPASERPQTYTLDRAATGTGPAPSRRRK